MVFGVGDWAEDETLVGEVEPETVALEEIPAYDAIHCNPACTQIA